MYVVHSAYLLMFFKECLKLFPRAIRIRMHNRRIDHGYFEVKVYIHPGPIVFCWTRSWMNASLLPKLLKSLTRYSIIAVSKHYFQFVNTCQVKRRATNTRVVFGVMIVDLIRNSCTFFYDFFSFFIHGFGQASNIYFLILFLNSSWPNTAISSMVPMKFPLFDEPYHTSWRLNDKRLSLKKLLQFFSLLQITLCFLLTSSSCCWLTMYSIDFLVIQNKLS